MLRLSGDLAELPAGLVGDALPLDTPSPVTPRRGRRKAQLEETEDAHLA
jgi:hypothetical protein